MKHDREFWTRHVGQWRGSGLTQAAYCRRHRLLKGTLGYWASDLKKPTEVKDADGRSWSREGRGPGSAFAD